MLLAELPITFERPWWLLVLLLIVPVFLLALRSIGGLSRAKAVATFTFRSIVIILLALALSNPSWVKKGEGVTVTILLDRSQSIPLPLKDEAVNFLKKAAQHMETREPEDRVAVVTIARDATIAAMPDAYSEVTVGQDVADPTATNLAGGVRIGLAIMPDDTGNRLLLASDGNETIGSVLEAAEIAKANGVPIDVLLLEYEYENEVIFDRIRAPARARRGQTATVTMSLRSQKQASGTIYLSMDGTVLDLNGPDATGEGMHVDLEPGRNVYQLEIALDRSGAVEFEATFEPDERSADYIDRNNNAYAVTFVGGEGKVLVIDDGVSESQYLMNALQEADIEVERTGPGGLVNLVYLSSFDAVVLANIPRYAFDDEQDKMLHAYVHDFGGGLVMLGGPLSFGAGGWIDSETSKVLPVKLDPPSSRQMPRGALALIMHSCEMPQGNYWGQQVAQAAIKALSSLDYIGIIEFAWGGMGAGGISGCTWAFPLQLAGDKSAALAATKQMQVGDMPAFGPSMQLALNGLTSVRAGQKHVIIISDGDPSPPSPALLNNYVKNKITVTTVMVGGHGTPLHRSRMQAVANKTGGRFYNVTNPKQLPKIFIKEAKLVSRSLIQEGEEFQPQVASRLPGPVEGFRSVPAVDGYVLTAMREGLTQNPIVISTKEGMDPFFSNWNYGLGRSIAYTSDVTGRWGARWASWGDFRAFWEQAIRWVMRPSGERNITINTHQEGDTAILEVEALGEDAASLNFLNAEARVHSPAGETTPIMLQQVGPGRYRAQFETDDAGAYIVDVSYTTGGKQERPRHLQAAVAVPYSDEFKSVKHNAALLRQLAEDTGGRMLSADDPALADLFNRDQIEIPKSPKSIWDLLAILAAIMFLLDVAARRLTIDPRRVRAMAGRAVGARQDTSTATVAAWKRTRQQVRQRQQPLGGARGETPPADRRQRFEADETDAGVAFDVGEEATAGPRVQQPGQPKRQQPKKSAAEDEEGDYTSRLLRAKRRAAGQDDGDESTKRDDEH